MYTDRREAGQVLAEKLKGYADERPKLLAVPRGGVIVAEPVGSALGVPVEVLIARKLGHPANPEVAIGAVMPDSSAILDEDAIMRFGISQEWLNEGIRKEYNEIRRRLIAYTGTEEAPAVRGRTVIVIDDGIATGYTIKAAIKWLKGLGPAKTVVAVPVAPPEVAAELAGQVDEVVCPLQPYDFTAVGMYYHDFSQTTDEEALRILKRSVQE